MKLFYVAIMLKKVNIDIHNLICFQYTTINCIHLIKNQRLLIINISYLACISFILILIASYYFIQLLKLHEVTRLIHFNFTSKYI